MLEFLNGLVDLNLFERSSCFERSFFLHIRYFVHYCGFNFTFFWPKSLVFLRSRTFKPSNKSPGKKDAQQKHMAEIVFLPQVLFACLCTHKLHSHFNSCFILVCIQDWGCLLVCIHARDSFFVYKTWAICLFVYTTGTA